MTSPFSSMDEVRRHQEKVKAWRKSDVALSAHGRPLTLKPGSLSVELPLRLVNGANAREHWSDRSKRAKFQRDTVAQFIRRKDLPALPAVVTITRMGPQALDSDNLAISAKHVRDGIAALYGIDDGKSCYDWRYAQGRGDYACRVEIETRKEDV